MNNMLKEYIDIKEAIKNPRSINLVIIISEKKFADANNINAQSLKKIIVK